MTLKQYVLLHNHSTNMRKQLPLNHQVRLPPLLFPSVSMFLTHYCTFYLTPSSRGAKNEEIDCDSDSDKSTRGMDEPLGFCCEESWKGELGVEKCAFYLGRG